MVYIKYAIPVALIALSGWLGYDYGVKSTHAEHQDKINDQLAEQDRLISELRNRKPEIRTKVREVYIEKDASGCADTAIPNGVLSQLKPDSN